jgi:hypothetical protein
VARHFPIGLEHGLDRIGFCSIAAATPNTVTGAALGEQAVQPPETGAAAIFIEAFHRHGAGRMARGAHHVGQEPFGQFIAIEDAVFRAFFVIDDEIHRHRARRAMAGGVAP